MPTLWGVDIQVEIANAATASDLPNFVLRKKPKGVRDPVNLAFGTNDGPPTNYKCWGVMSQYTAEEMAATAGVQRGDQKFTIIAKPLADAGVEPEDEDLIVDGTKTYTIVRVRTNSAKAVYECQCRG
jgi:hypothetical protein